MLIKNKNIVICGAKEHNLKNVNVTIPKYTLSVVSGVSGSGKSSLCLSTLYAEGQRRYAESLSAYSRQFIAQLKKPKVESIENICPAIALEQKTNTNSSRSTVATLSGVYDYLKILYAKLGKTYSPISGEEVREDNVYDVLSFIEGIKDNDPILLLAPIKYPINKDTLSVLLSKGYTRLYYDENVIKIESLLDSPQKISEQIYLLIQRFKPHAKNTGLSSNIKQGFLEGDGKLIIKKNHNYKAFSNSFELDGITFEKPNQYLFSFSSPYGACQNCEGYGSVLGINPKLVIPDENLSLYDNAVACWRGEKMRKWKQNFISKAQHLDFPIFRSYNELTQKEKDLLWNGDKSIKGINSFFKKLEEKSYKIQYRVLLSRYRGRTLCNECHGTRLRKETQYVKIDNKSLPELLKMDLVTLESYFNKIKYDGNERLIGKKIISAINERLKTLNTLGLGYLNMSRDSRTLSGGETQRINLAKFLSSPLVEALYILDEPSIGLHPRDTHALISVLKNLCSKQNTVILVEHDEDIIRASDWIVDMGPMAGELGGEVMYSGPSSKLNSCSSSITADYISGKRLLPKLNKTIDPKAFIKIVGANQHNLNNLDLKIPLNCIVAVTGVSGSGKTTLVNKIIYQNLDRLVNQNTTLSNNCKHINFPKNSFERVEFINQNPIGKSSRSNPMTYIKAYDSIRKLMANQAQSKLFGLGPGHFSFNSEGGRCPSCKGDGNITIEMQFLPDVSLRCEDCKGKRFKSQVLEIEYKGNNIYDILQLTVDDALILFAENQDIIKKLAPLQKVGLGYIRLGQASSTLSGGEAQRVKLASFLTNINNSQPCLFIFDEPTTGLHTHDISKLYDTFKLLINHGHSILLVEHNTQLIKLCDWIIDLGPDGGKLGGQLIFEGPLHEIKNCKQSITAKYLN